ncbi:hypothetical protein BJ965_006909 [Streptomyces luteogriseus]|uniref:Uncharacterized protein n=1 Tax=Streptomyces luteogriseus TaxID=68233 RepID=A0A7W7DX65_9ACTN|nr:hypothetical protein [Streptomyces luteogriseus]
MELQAEVEQQQHQSECREHLEVVGVLDDDQAGGVGAEEDAREHEQRDRGEADSAAEAGEEGGGQEGSAHGEKAVSVSHGSPPSWTRRRIVSPNGDG